MSALPIFQVGDKVVYPNHGVGVIETISSRAIGESQQQFYLLKIETSNLRVMVPFANVESVGMRAVTQARELEPILNYLEHPEPAAAPGDWKCRFKENSEKMRSGSLAQVAEVLKTLTQLHQLKPLSFREKKMLDRAVTLLTGEIASANGVALDQSLLGLQRCLAKADLILPPPEPDDDRRS